MIFRTKHTHANIEHIRQWPMLWGRRRYDENIAPSDDIAHSVIPYAPLFNPTFLFIFAWIYYIYLVRIKPFVISTIYHP